MMMNHLISLLLYFYFSKQTVSAAQSSHRYVCRGPRLDADPYNIRKSVDLGGNTDNVRIIYNSVSSLLAGVSSLS